MEIIQSAAAVYILICVGTFVSLILRAAWMDKPASYNFKGLPIYALTLAAVICAISTLGSLS